MATGSVTVLHLVGHDAHRKGAQIGQLALTRRLAARGSYKLDLTLLSGGLLVPEFRSVVPGATVLDEPIWPRLARTLHRKPRFAAFDTSRADVLLVNSAASLPAFVGMTPACPVVLFVHELQSVLDHVLDEQSAPLLRTLPSRWLAASHPVAENLVERWGVPAERVVVVPEFIPDQPGLAPALASGPRTVLGCGFMDHRKGGDLFLAAARAHRSMAAEPAEWVWLGIPDAQIAAAADGHVTFPGPTDNPGPWFDAAAVFALTSREDPMPLVALEALQRGRPVVCFAGSGGIPGVVGDQLGTVVPPEEPVAFATAVEAWLNDRAGRERLLAEGPVCIVRSHSVEVGERAISAVLADVLST